MKRLISSFRFALSGIRTLLLSERNFQIHLLALSVVIILGIYYHVSRKEWVALALASGLVLGFEALNTSIEKLANVVHPRENNQIKNIKDIAAGATLIAAITAFCIGLFVFLPHIIPGQ